MGQTSDEEVLFITSSSGIPELDKRFADIVSEKAGFPITVEFLQTQDFARMGGGVDCITGG